MKVDIWCQSRGEGERSGHMWALGGRGGQGRRLGAVCMYRAVCVYKVRSRATVPCCCCAMKLNEIEIGTALGHSNLDTMSLANEPAVVRDTRVEHPHCHFTTQPPPTRATHLSSSIHRESRPAGGLLMPSALRWRPRHVLFFLQALCFAPRAVPVSCCRATLSSMGPSTMQLETIANRERPNDVIEHGSND
jgi:hypothetical protein